MARGKKVTFADLLDKNTYEKAVQQREENRERDNRKAKRSFGYNDRYDDNELINAYNFVSLGDPENIKRGECKPGNLSGKIICTLTNLTPLFTGGKKSEIQVTNSKGKKIEHGQEFFLADDKNYLIAATSLKGTIRNVLEVVTTSCIKNVKEKGVPREFMPCSSEKKLCFACRLFGTTGDNDNPDVQDTVSLGGRVFFTDAVLDKKSADVVSEVALIKALGQPHATYKNFYYEKDKRTIRGRKFYWHHGDKIDAGKNVSSYYNTCLKDKEPARYNSSIQYLKPMNKFTFEVRFTRLTEEELGVLIYSLELEKGMAHKFGKAKSLGLGSCEIKIDKLLLESEDKYKAFTKAYRDGDTKKYKDECMKKYITDNRIEIKELKGILSKKNGINFSKRSFPELKWFNKNKNTVLPKILDY